MSAKLDPKDKTFLITGGASGLGAVYTEWFLKEGAKSIAILDILVEKGQALTAKLNALYPGNVVFYECDVGDEAKLSDVFNRVIENFGQLDAIVNNAGMMNDSPDGWKKSADVTWRGLVSLTLKGVKHMRTDEGGAGGTIINISSTAALVRTPFLPIYSGNKAAVLHFGQCISMDPFYANTGVSLLTFCLGPTETPLLDNLADRTWDEKNKKILVDYVATETVKQTPEFAADAIVKIFKEGENGSIWLTTLNKPTRDITSNYRAAFETVEDLARS